MGWKEIINGELITALISTASSKRFTATVGYGVLTYVLATAGLVVPVLGITLGSAGVIVSLYIWSETMRQSEGLIKNGTEREGENHAGQDN